MSRRLLVLVSTAWAAVAFSRDLFIEPAEVQVTANEPVELTFRLTNSGSRAIRLNLGGDFNFDFNVRLLRAGSVHGEDLPWQHRQSPDEGVFGSTVSLEPMDQFSRPLLLNEWWSPSVPGSYELEVGLPGFKDRARVKVHVLPRDPYRLRSVCAKLAALTLAEPGGLESFRSARVLSYVRDVEAVPYLEEVGNADESMAPIVLKGLVRIPDPSAVRAIASLVRSRNTVISAMARGSLAQMARPVSGAGDHR